MLDRSSIAKPRAESSRSFMLDREHKACLRFHKKSEGIDGHPVLLQ
jgi:hypothetical protein